MLFGGSVDAVTLLALLVAFGTVVGDVAFQVLPRKSEGVASTTLNDLQRALVQMIVKITSTDWRKLTAIWALDQSLGTLSKHVVFKLIVRDLSLTTLVNTREGSPGLELLNKWVKLLRVLEVSVAAGTSLTLVTLEAGLADNLVAASTVTRFVGYETAVGACYLQEHRVWSSVQTLQLRLQLLHRGIN